MYEHAQTDTSYVKVSNKRQNWKQLVTRKDVRRRSREEVTVRNSLGIHVRFGTDLHHAASVDGILPHDRVGMGHGGIRVRYQGHHHTGTPPVTM